MRIASSEDNGLVDELPDPSNVLPKNSKGDLDPSEGV